MTDLKENNVGQGLSMNKIYNMDCIEGMKLIPDGSIDAIITDPPYGTTACKWDTVIPFDLMREQLNRIIKPNGAIVLFGSEPFSSALRMSNIKNYRYDFIWDKIIGGDFLNAKKKPLKGFEKISVFYKKLPTYNPQFEDGKPFIDKRDFDKRIEKEVYGNIPGPKKQENSGTRYPRGFIKISARNNKPLHPTQKPVALIEYLIKTYTNEGETVLDFTAGSFTTAVAADNTNRKRIGIEMSEEYCEIGKERIIKNRIEKGLDLLDFTSNI